MSYFRDRQQAGEQLAQKVVSALSSMSSPLPIRVYALPKGGIPVAIPVARACHCPLEVLVAKKITLPENPELALGAVLADGDVLWGNWGLAKLSFHQKQSALSQACLKAQEQQLLWGESDLFEQRGEELVLVVDDGIATGLTMGVAVQGLRKQGAKKVWICSPVAPTDLLPQLQLWADQVLILHYSQEFLSVSRFYEEFDQVESQQALSLLREYNQLD